MLAVETARIVIVDTDVSTNPNYTSLAAALNAEHGTLTQALEIHARASSGIPDNREISTQGIVTTATSDLTIIFEAGYTLDVTANKNYFYGIRILSDHVTLRGKGGRLKVNNNGYISTFGIYSSGHSTGAKVIIENMSIQGEMTGNTNNYGIVTYNTDTIHVIRNNVITGFVGHDAFGLFLYYGNFSYNNTVVGNQTGIRLINPTGELYNNISVNNVVGDFYKWQTFDGVATGHNISFDGSSPDVAYQNKIVQFLDPRNNDYSLHSNDIVALDQGIDLSTASYPLTTDHDNNIRNGAWDIGAYSLDLLTFDTDNDGMSDRWEQSYGLDPLINDAQGDGDNDNLNNIAEYQNGSSPLLADSDFDGVNDGNEVTAGTSPIINNIVRTIIVDTDASTNPDYTSLASAIDALQGILTQPIEIRARASSITPDIHEITTEGIATNETSDLTIIFETGYSLNIIANKNYFYWIKILSDHVTLRGEGGQLKVKNNGYTAVYGIYSSEHSPGTKVIIENMTIQGEMTGNTNNYGIKTYSANAIHIIRNNVVTGFVGHDAFGLYLYYGNYSYNNTVVGNQTGVRFINPAGDWGLQER